MTAIPGPCHEKPQAESGKMGFSLVPRIEHGLASEYQGLSVNLALSSLLL